MTTVTVAATQMACSTDAAANLDKAEGLVRDAAAKGANIVLLQELFENVYFPQSEDPDHFALARPFENNPTLARFQALARELGVVLPVSFFERDNNAHYNALAIVDADGTCLGRYRKSHIPHGFGYQEKFYFNPGDTGFKAWDTTFGRIGCAICWDQWFPECARAMVLQGAEILFYPTAIGSVTMPGQPDSARRWQRAMQGHAASNTVPVVASNRTGTEYGDGTEIAFYGTSFICDESGEVVEEAGRGEETVLTAAFDLAALRAERAAWALFRDRRPDLYGPLLTLDGADSPMR